MKKKQQDCISIRYRSEAVLFLCARKLSKKSSQIVPQTLHNANELWRLTVQRAPPPARRNTTLLFRAREANTRRPQARLETRAFKGFRNLENKKSIALFNRHRAAAAFLNTRSQEKFEPSTPLARCGSLRGIGRVGSFRAADLAAWLAKNLRHQRTRRLRR